MARRALAESILSIGANRAVTVPATATLRVRERGGTALASIYSASSGGTALPNPVTVTNGLPAGYVDMGSYDLMATASGVDSETWEWEAVVATSVVSKSQAGFLSGSAAVPATVVTGVSATASGTTLTGPSGSFTSDMTGQNFSLLLGGKIIATAANMVDADDQDGGWEASPLVGTVTYVSSTTLTLSTAVITTVADGEIIIGTDQTSVIQAALDDDSAFLIPRDTTYFIEDLLIGSRQQLVGQDRATSRLVCPSAKGNGILSFDTYAPVAENFTMIGGGRGEQPAGGNVTPSPFTAAQFVTSMADCGSGITFAHTTFHRRSNITIKHFGGGWETADNNPDASGYNGISAFYSTLGCRHGLDEGHLAQYNRSGFVEDSYFDPDAGQALGRNYGNHWVNCHADKNRYGWGIDSGALSRGGMAADCTATWNIMFGFEVVRTRHYLIRDCKAYWNGRGRTKASNFYVHGTAGGSATCEHTTLENIDSHAAGSHGVKISEFAHYTKVTGRVAYSGQIGVFITNGCIGTRIGDETHIRNSNTSGDVGFAGAGVAITGTTTDACTDTKIGRVAIEAGSTAAMTYGITETGDSTGTVVDDEASIVGATTLAVELAGSTSRPGTSAKRRKILLANGLALKGETFDRNIAGGAFAPTAGDLRGVLVPMVAGEKVTNLHCHVTAAGSGVTLAKGVIYNKTGATLYAQSADVDSTFNSGTGVKDVPLSAAWTVPTDDVYFVAFVFVGGTSPTILRGTSGISGYSSVAPTGGIAASVVNAGQTDAPSTLTLTATGTVPWFAWS
jgi:hypothetical protein